MKARRVIVTLELETVEPISALRSKSDWEYVLGLGAHTSMTVLQVQANVVKGK